VPSLTYPPKLKPGDRVAVLSPSAPLAAVFPQVYELGLARLRGLGLEPVEYPTTRVAGAPAAERARDVMAALTDPSIAAVLASIGGDDQITVLRHLDEDAMTAHPKRFLGYSDCTNLSNWLWAHGIGSVYGGSTMVHVGPGPQIEPYHLPYLRAALFGGEVELHAPERTWDVGLAWDRPEALVDMPASLPAEPWTWAGPQRSVTGPVWGGCLEIVEWTMAVGRWMGPLEDYQGCVLALELSEERPPPDEAYRLLRNLGERGILGVASALLWGRPPVHGLDEDPVTEGDAAAKRAQYREAVLRAVGEYADDLPVVMDVDFGHTSPQLVLPYGGEVTVDAEQRRLTARL